jgi:hypothetical protein
VLLIVSRAQRRQMIAVLVVPLVVLVLLKGLVYPVMGVTSSGAQPPLELQLHDIADAVAHHPDMFNESDRAFMNTVGPFDLWGSTYNSVGCWSANWEWDKRFNWSVLDGHVTRLLSLWLKVVQTHPSMVARNRLCVGALAFRPDNDGVLFTASRGIYGNPDGLRTMPISEALHDRAVSLLDRLDENDVQSWAWRAPGWIYLADIVFIFVAVRRRRWLLLLPVLPLAMLQFAVFVVNPAQDARYMLPGLVLAVMLVAGGTLAFPGTTVHQERPARQVR